MRLQNIPQLVKVNFFYFSEMREPQFDVHFDVKVEKAKGYEKDTLSSWHTVEIMVIHSHTFCESNVFTNTV